MDTNPKAINYYRLHQIDIDGSRNYSQVVLARGKRSIELSLYPNPTNNIIYINTYDAQVEEVSIFNAVGEKVAFYHGDMKQINISDLSDGVYVIHIKTNESVSTTKVIKR